MKRLLYFLTFVLLAAVCLTSIFAAETVVYVDGTAAVAGDGKTPQTAYKTLAEGMKAVASGGTVVVTGDITFSSPTTLVANTEKVKITSSYGGVDYNASLVLKTRIVLAGEIEFDDINFANMGTTQRYIIARNYPLTMGEGVTCTSEKGGKLFPCIFGGRYNTAGTGNNSLMVKGGTWYCIYGGNSSAAHTGNSEITVLGGTVLHSVVGGSHLGGFNGNSKITIGGNAVVEFDAEGGVIGANRGDTSDTVYAFTGDSEIVICGNATVHANVLGVSCMDNVTAIGDIMIDICGDAVLTRNVYGAGFNGHYTAANDGVSVTVRENAKMLVPSDLSIVYLSAGPMQGTATGALRVTVKDNAYVGGSVCGAGFKGTVKGNSTAILYGGAVNNNFTAGSARGTVNGDAVTTALGGTVGGTSSSSDLRGNGGYISESTKGKVTGTATVLLDGAEVIGAITLGGATGSVTLKSGSAGTAPDKLVIDLGAGGDLHVGGAVNASSVHGGGTLTLSAAGSLTTDTLHGTLAVNVIGKVWPGTTYVRVSDPQTNGNVVYGGSGAVFTKTIDESGVCFTVNSEYLTTKVTVTYYNPDTSGKQPDIVFYKIGGVKITDGITFALNQEGKNTATVELAPGLYNYKVYYDGASDYLRKYFYVSGKTATLDFECALRPFVEKAYMEPIMAHLPDEIIDTFFGMEGYPRLDTPSFVYHADDNRTFASNAEICAYLEALDAACDYMYLFYPFALSEYGNKYPVVVFTKDAIPEGATLDEVGEVVRSGGIREIIMTTGGVHGQEPGGIESQLAFSKELAGAYGEKIFSNEKIGAIVIIPCVSVDNYQRLAREYLYDPTLLYKVGINPQRNLMALQRDGTQNQVYVYKTFMPTVYIDNHEDYTRVRVDTTDLSLTYPSGLSYLEDVAIRYSALMNSPLVDIHTVIAEDVPENDRIGMDMQMSAIDRVNEIGIRAGVYYISNTMPNTSWPYAKARGSYGFLIESMRIQSGKTRYERCVFSHTAALKAVTDEVYSRAGELAENVYNSRQAAAVTVFDPNRYFAKSTTASGRLVFNFKRIAAYIDGTIKDEALDVTMSQHDTVSDFIAMPTAYVLPADGRHIESILHLLDMHGIRYTRIVNGSTLTLRQYTGLDTVNTSEENVQIGETTEVTFENGAYVITTDTSDSYLIAYLFEPDSYPFTSYDENTHSLANMGYIADGDLLYRAETDNIAETIASMLYVREDMDGDGAVSISDVLAMIRLVLNGSNHTDADINGDGKVNLVDAIRLLKMIVA